MAEEWLPPGWTVEIKVRKSGKKDWCYFDPSKERKFKSKPEVLRYLKTIERISDPEEKRRSSRNRSPLDSPAVAEQAELADSGINGRNTKRQRSKPTGTLKVEKTLESCAGEETSALDSIHVNKSTNGASNPATVPESPPQNKNVPKVDISGNKRLQIGNNNKSQNTDKKVGSPRRASKRLAGVEVGPIPELTPDCKSRRVSCRKVDDIDIATAKSSLDDTKMTTNEDNTHDNPSESSPMPNRHSINKCDGVANVPINKSNDVAGVSLEVPMQDLWNDPCIEFAIKTLTGQIPIEEELGKDKAFVEGWEPCKESNFGDLWADPCIRFAVKTLTGDIPNDDSSSQNYFQKRDKGLDFSLGLGSVSKMDCFPQNENSSLLKVGDGGVRHRCEGRDGREDRKRPTGSLVEFRLP